MKHKKPDSALHRIGGLFTRDFGLKLLSLALAILIYEVLKPEAMPSEKSHLQNPNRPNMFDSFGSGGQARVQDKTESVRTPPQRAAEPTPATPAPPAETRTKGTPPVAGGKTTNSTTRSSNNGNKNNGKPRK